MENVLKKMRHNTLQQGKVQSEKKKTFRKDRNRENPKHEKGAT